MDQFTLTYPHGQCDNPTFSLIFPHLRNEINDACLTICLDAIKKYTKHPYELMIVEDPPGGRIDPYEAWNLTIPLAKSDHIMFSNTDVIFAPDWDVNFVKYFEENTILVQYLVECGAIGVHHNNIAKNFGKNPSTFNQAAFEKFVTAHSANVPEVLDFKCNGGDLGAGWYMPSYMNRKLFMRAGMFKTDMPFMARPNDILLFGECNKLGTRFRKVKSYAYHFQNLSHKPRVG